MERPLTFDPNSNDHLEWTLKLAYRYAEGNMLISGEDVTSACMDALCNLIGDDAFCEFLKSGEE